MSARSVNVGPPHPATPLGKPLALSCRHCDRVRLSAAASNVPPPVSKAWPPRSSKRPPQTCCRSSIDLIKRRQPREVGVVVSCISHFRTELRMKVDAIESELNELALRITHGEAGSDQLVRKHIERLTWQLARQRSVRVAAESVLKLCGRNDEATPAHGAQLSGCVHSPELNGRVTCAQNRA